MSETKAASAGAPATILFLGFWGLDDPLTASSLLPGAQLFLNELGARRVLVATVERSAKPPALRLPEGMVHLPLPASTLRSKAMARAKDQLAMTAKLVATVKREGVGLIIARTSNAGSLAHWTARLTGVPYIVESFEPHAQYMAECGEWDPRGALYRATLRLEALQKRHALGLITVSHTYRERLVKEGVDPARIEVAPCPVPLDRFAPDAAARRTMRSQLDDPDVLVGVYAGKFGGLYHRERAFDLFSAVRARIGERFRLLLLTPAPHDGVRDGLAAAGFPLEHALIRSAPHAEMPAWLSGADFAFAPYRKTSSCAFLSPVKIGEYWACGLPVMLTPGVGDDSDIIASEPLSGVLQDPAQGDPSGAIDRLVAIVNNAGHVQACRSLAERHRDIAHTRRAYQALLLRGAPHIQK